MRTVEVFVVNMFTTKSETQQKHLVLIYNSPSWVKLVGLYLQTHLVCLFGLVWLFTCKHILDKRHLCRSLRDPPPLSPRLDSCNGCSRQWWHDVENDDTTMTIIPWWHILNVELPLSVCCIHHGWVWANTFAPCGGLYLSLYIIGYIFVWSY